MSDRRIAYAALEATAETVWSLVAVLAWALFAVRVL